jgi:hypothetical protein
VLYEVVLLAGCVGNDRNCADILPTGQGMSDEV